MRPFLAFLKIVYIMPWKGDKKKFLPVLSIPVRKRRKEIPLNIARFSFPCVVGNRGVNFAAELAKAPPSPTMVSAESPHRGSRHFLRARFYHSTKIRLSLILSYGNLVGVATPNPPFCGLRRLKKFFQIFSKTLPLLPLFFSH